MKTSGKSEKKLFSWWHLVLGVDAFLVAVTVLWISPVTFPGKGRLTSLFNLAVEMNVGVWWSGACLLALGVLAWELYCREKEKPRLPWLVLAVVFACLSLDEIGSIHERVGGWSNLLPFGVVLGAMVGYALTLLFHDRKTRRSALLIAWGFFLFGSVALQEYIGNIVTWRSWASGIRTGVEEGSELIGAFLIFLALIPHRSRNGGSSLRAAVPNPFVIKHVPKVLMAGLILHSLGSFLAPRFIDIAEKGNPLVWYPMAVFFLLFAAAFWKFLDSSPERPALRAALALFFLACSAGFCYPPEKVSNQLWGMVPPEILPGVFLFCIAAGLLVLSAGISDLWSNSRWYFIALLLLPSLSLLSRSPEIRFLVSGLFAYLLFTVYWRARLSNPQAAIHLDKESHAVMQ
jgi:hypothetical protein